MKLNKLIDHAPKIDVESIMCDSRQVSEKAIFFCIKGIMHDGHRFVKDAIKNGAICVVHSEDFKDYDESVTYIKVSDTVEALNMIAAKFYDNPSQKLTMYGITGTNGKSSVAMMIKDMIDHYNSCGYIGTIAIEYDDIKLPPLLTTPEVVDIQRILADMVKHKVDSCALELSSIGLEQRRVDEVKIDVAVFTNLTHDHFDYHGTMENYFLAKKIMFDRLKPEQIAIYNIDDEYGPQIVKDTKARCYSYGIEYKADYLAKDIELLSDKTVFTLVCFGNEYRVETPFLAKFNIYNILAAIAALHQSHYDMNEIIDVVGSIRQIEGRIERVLEGQPFNIFVDFAHTPDGLEKIFQFAAEITPVKNRIIGVFGSAGKRDTKKRPIFGQLADRYCDMIILTADDPRDENPLDIASEIAEGIDNTNYIIIESRYDAIRQAIEMANKNDTILLLGKGDEEFMYGEFGREAWIGDQNAAKEILHKFYFFDDLEEE